MNTATPDPAPPVQVPRQRSYDQAVHRTLRKAGALEKRRAAFMETGVDDWTLPREEQARRDRRARNRRASASRRANRR